MKTVKTLTLLTICVTSIALADDFKTVDGKEYKNVTVSRVEPDGIMIMSSSGISKVYFTELPKEVQERFQYDAAKGDAYSAEQTANQLALYKQRQESEQQQLEERKRYWSEHPMPVLVERQSVAASKQGSMLDQRPSGGNAASMQGSMLDQRPSGGNVLIYGKVIQVVDEGLLVSVRETNTVGQERIPSYTIVLLEGQFPGFYDNDKIQATGTMIGPHNYTAVWHYQKTVRAFEVAQINKLTEFPPNVRD